MNTITLIFYPYEWHTDLSYCLCSSGRLLSIHPAILHGRNCNVEHYMDTFLPDSSNSAMLTGTIDFYPFFSTTCSDLDLGWGSYVQHKTKAPGFIFSHSFQLNAMKVGMVIKQFKLHSIHFDMNVTLTLILSQECKKTKNL